MSQIAHPETPQRMKLRLLGEVNRFLETHLSDWTEAENEEYTKLHKALMDAVNAQLDREAPTSGR